MKKMNKLAALILALLMLVSATTAFAGTYVSDPISPTITKPDDGGQQPELEATPAPEGEAVLEPTPVPEGEQPVEETPAPQEIEATVQTESEGGSVNIRAAASTDSEILGQLSRDARVTVLGVEGDWIKIRADGITGYVYSKYLNIETPAETAVPEESVEPDATEVPVETIVPEETLLPEITPVPEETPLAEQAREVRIHSTLGDVVNMGDTVNMTCELIGFDGVQVALQWQRNSGDGWRDVDGATGLTYSFSATEDMVNSSWRIAVSIVQ